ncbi:MAG: ATP-dependent metallopeptidase FtsH/Yme1/Tma family protein [Sphaerochaetaceae bacterium]|jgi:cell division protease FtsH
MKQKSIIIIGIFVLLAAAALLWLGQPQAQAVEYREFAESLEEGKISSVSIKKDSLVFSLSGDGLLYRTANPGSSDLKERLLLSGVKVEDSSEEDMLGYVMDMAFNVIFFGLIAFGIMKLVQAYSKTYRVVRKTGVSFDDIAGMDDIKTEMMRVVDVLKNPSRYSGKGIRQIKGIILEGLPGNGKTMFAKALAQESHVNFIATKGADFQSALMSMGAMKLRMLFAKARRRKPCIVFIDEFDSIGERRNYAGTGIDKENNRIITTMLNEMDGFASGSGILVVAATNSYASLDPALIRPGRFDLKFNIGNPDQNTRLKLVELYTKTRKLDDSLDKVMLAQAFDGLSCSAIEAILNEASVLASMAGRPAISYDDIALSAAKTASKIRLRR